MKETITEQLNLFLDLEKSEAIEIANFLKLEQIQYIGSDFIIEDKEHHRWTYGMFFKLMIEGFEEASNFKEKYEEANSIKYPIWFKELFSITGAKEIISFLKNIRVASISTIEDMPTENLNNLILRYEQLIRGFEQLQIEDIYKKILIESKRLTLKKKDDNPKRNQKEDFNKIAIEKGEKVIEVLNTDILPLEKEKWTVRRVALFYLFLRRSKECPITSKWFSFGYKYASVQLHNKYGLSAKKLELSFGLGKEFGLGAKAERKEKVKSVSDWEFVLSQLGKLGFDEAKKLAEDEYQEIKN